MRNIESVSYTHLDVYKRQGLSGATDSNFVLRKSQRRENTATLYCTGRDILYRELALEFDGEDHVWKLLSDDCEQKKQPNERILFLLSELLRRQPEISAPAKMLLEKIDPAGTEGDVYKRQILYHGFFIKATANRISFHRFD